MSPVPIDFYYEDYIDYASQSDTFSNYTAVSTTPLTWDSLLRLVLTILLRIGFVLFQIGNVPISNVNLIFLQNAIDLCCVTVTYFLMGFLIAYNGVAGLIGAGHWIGDPTIDKNEAIMGWQAVTITSAIFTTAVAGRMHIAGYLLVSILLSGLIQPLLFHWAWMGWMAKNELGGKTVVFKDQAGAAVIHIVGGFSGLIGCIVLGKRKIRKEDLHTNYGSERIASGGLLLIFAGLPGHLCTSLHEYKYHRMFIWDSTHIYINNLLAASSCIIRIPLESVLNYDLYDDNWVFIKGFQGIIAGVVTVSAAPNDYSPQIAIVLGCLGGIVCHFVSRWIFHSTLADYCNVVAIHLICAILGSILTPFFAMRRRCADEDTVTILLNFSWQLISLVALLALVGTAMLLIFSILERCGILRNKLECVNHRRSNAPVDRAPSRSFLQRLFSPNSDCLYLDSTFSTGHHPSIGSRFSKHQEEINKLEEERPTITIYQQNVNVKIEDDVTEIPMSGARVKRMRQVHTLSGSTLPLCRIENGGGTSESIDKDLSVIGGKRFLGKGIKCTLDPIEEIDEEILKVFEIEKNSVQLSIDDCNAGDKNPISEYFNVSGDRKDLNESNYQLRRTIKFTNLHNEFVKEDLKVVLGPNRLDSSSSDSCDDDTIFAKTSDLNKPIKDIVIND